MMVGGYAVLKRRINLLMLESSKGGGIVIGALNLLCSKVLELRLEVPLNGIQAISVLLCL